MRIEPLSIPGCFEIFTSPRLDERGRFAKVFHHDEFERLGLETELREQYFTESFRGVLRGLHFQIPPSDHAKLVCCVQGEVVDAMVDLRRGSPTYCQHVVRELSGELANALYIPRGVAHGFLVSGERATMLYSVTSVHRPEHDRGIHWNSAGIAWPELPSLVSPRDQTHPPLSEFDSPFCWKGLGP